MIQAAHFAGRGTYRAGFERLGGSAVAQPSGSAPRMSRAGAGDTGSTGGTRGNQPVAASWPHAAAMSRPRVRRTVAGTRARSRTALNAAIASRDEPSYKPVGL